MKAWQRLSRQQRSALSIGGGVAIAWLAYLWVLRPLHRQFSQLTREVRETERQLTEAIVAGKQADAVNRMSTAYQAYAGPSGSPEAELGGFLSEVESAVRQSGMTVLNLKPAAPREGSTDAISVTLEAESSPAQLVQMLDLLQRSTRLLKVTELTVRVTEAKTLRNSFVISKLLLK